MLVSASAVALLSDACRARWAIADIRVSVKAELFLTGEADCDEDPVEPSLRTFDVTYRWDFDAGRFLPNSDALDILAKENEERF